MNKSVHSPVALKKPAGASSPAVNAETTTKTPGSSTAVYKLAGLIIAAVFSWYIYSSGSSSILNLSKATEAELREALFKPHRPYVFYCIKVRAEDVYVSVYVHLHALCADVRIGIAARGYTNPHFFPQHRELRATT